MLQSIHNRTGARRPDDVPLEVLRLLERGCISTVNLSEWVAVDLGVFVKNIFHDTPYACFTADLQKGLRTVDGGQLKKFRFLGTSLTDHVLRLSGDGAWHDLQMFLREHVSDIGRSLACHMHEARDCSLEALFSSIRDLAADSHYAVRESAWLSVRRRVILDLDSALHLLFPWVHDHDPYIRRFAIEVTRPRGVWCEHISALKQEPQKALFLLNPLYAESQRYVQDSVANWLNDASKTHARWTENICQLWLQHSDSPETAYITRRALRTVRKRSSDQ